MNITYSRKDIPAKYKYVILVDGFERGYISCSQASNGWNQYSYWYAVDLKGNRIEHCQRSHTLKDLKPFVQGHFERAAQQEQYEARKAHEQYVQATRLIEATAARQAAIPVLKAAYHAAFDIKDAYAHQAGQVDAPQRNAANDAITALMALLEALDEKPAIRCDNQTGFPKYTVTAL